MYKNCTYYVYILSSFLYAGFMLYKFYMQLYCMLASFLSLKLSLLLSILLLLDIRNSTAINVPYPFYYVKLRFNTPGYCLCSCCLCKTLLQYYWLLSMQLLAIRNSAAILLAIVYAAAGYVKLCCNTTGYCLCSCWLCKTLLLYY
jgi:hypothetical protein